MRMIFMGRKRYAAEMLLWTLRQGIEIICVCSGDNEVINSAHSLNIPVFSMEEAEEISGEADFVVSYLYNRKIRKPLIDSPRFGCINFHPAILPDWRGTAGYNVAILEKLPEWGATAHYVDENIDTGAIIRVYKFNFDYRLETASSLERKTQAIQKELYKSIILDVVQHGRLEAVPQDLNKGRYISHKEMLQMMLLDKTNLEAEQNLDLKIRAFWFPPFDGAGFEINGKFYTLVNHEILSEITHWGGGTE